MHKRRADRASTADKQCALDGSCTCEGLVAVHQLGKLVAIWHQAGAACALTVVASSHVDLNYV